MSCAKSEHFFEMVNGIASHNISDFNDVQNHVFINKDIFEFKKGKFSLLSMIESEPYHSSEIFEKSRSPPKFSCFFSSDASPYDSLLNEVSMPKFLLPYKV